MDQYGQYLIYEVILKSLSRKITNQCLKLYQKYNIIFPILQRILDTCHITIDCNIDTVLTVTSIIQRLQFYYKFKQMLNLCSFVRRQENPFPSCHSPFHLCTNDDHNDTCQAFPKDAKSDLNYHYLETKTNINYTIIYSKCKV